MFSSRELVPAPPLKPLSEAGVVARRRVAEDREVEEAAPVGGAVEARVRPLQVRVPHARAVDLDARGRDARRVGERRRHLPGAGRDPHALAHVPARVDARLQRAAVVLAVAGLGAAIGGQRERVRGLRERRPHVLEIDQIDDVVGRHVGGVLLELHLRAGRDLAHERAHLVVVVVRAALAGIVARARLAAVAPRVARRQRQRLPERAADVEVQGRGRAAAAGRVGDDVTHDDGVGARRRREFDGLALRLEAHRAAARGLARDRPEGSIRADGDAVRRGRLGLVLEPRHGGAARRHRRGRDLEELARVGHHAGVG